MQLLRFSMNIMPVANSSYTISVQPALVAAADLNLGSDAGEASSAPLSLPQRPAIIYQKGNHHELLNRSVIEQLMEGVSSEQQLLCDAIDLTSMSVPEEKLIRLLYRDVAILEYSKHHPLDQRYRPWQVFLDTLLSDVELCRVFARKIYGQPMISKPMLVDFLSRFVGSSRVYGYLQHHQGMAKPLEAASLSQ